MLKGTLDDFTLPDIFRLLSQSKRTGSLEVERSAGRGIVYFKEGDVYFAESSISKELLGQKLVRAKVLTSGQLMKALDEQATSGGRLGDVLVASGLVFAEQLEAALRAQIEDAVFDLLRWELGEFTWQAGESVEPEVELSVSVENLIMEASRRLDELEVIKRKIPSEATVLTMAPTPPEGAVEINITPEEWRVMVLVNGVRSVQEIAEAVGLDVFQAMRTLHGLVSAGLVEAPEGVEETAVRPGDAGDREVVEGAADAALENVTGFDAPAPGEITMEAPELDTAAPEDAVDEPVPVEEPAAEEVPVEPATASPDPFAAELGGDEPVEEPEADLTAASSDETVPAAPDETIESELDRPVATVTDIPVSAEPTSDDVAVDKSAAVRELSNLFRQTEVEPGSTYSAPPPVAQESPDAEPAPPEERKRVEDDEEITRGLISRLIDGVKGL
ncbi:MAG: DUF4388 domain-containing protein [Actinomycetota bacterium]|nr:DUF4388 domain-containing protein [Actinomycetota bacterium]